MLAEHRDLLRREEAQLSAQAVAAGIAARPARSAAQGEALETHGIPVLQHFGVGDPRVRHVGMDSARPPEPRPGSGPAADRLVVAEGVVAEQCVVHRALPAGTESQRLDQRVDDPLARLDVAADDRRAAPRIGRKLRVQHAARDLDLDRFEQPLVELEGHTDQQPQHVDRGAPYDRRRRVQVAGVDGCTAREVDPRRTAIHRHLDLDRRTVIQAFPGVERLAAGAPHVVLQGRPHALGGARVERRHVTADLLLTGVGGELAKGCHPAPVGGHGRAQVGQVLRHRAGRGRTATQEGLDPLPLRLPRPYQVLRRDDHALFRQVAGLGRHRARPDAAQFSVVCPVGDVTQQPAVDEDRRDDRDQRREALGLRRRARRRPGGSVGARSGRRRSPGLQRRRRGR